MDTKWGPLASLDTGDVEVLKMILQWDKHAQLEGMIMEHIFDQIADKTEPYGMEKLEVYTAIAQNYHGASYAIVWLTTNCLTPAARKYLAALSKMYGVYIAHYDDNSKTFVASKTEYDPEKKGKYENVPLQQLMQTLSNKTPPPDFPNIEPKDKEVVDPTRQQQAFWGFLNAVSGEHLYREMVLPRLFMNFGISPYFYAHDIDRVFLLNSVCGCEDLVILEVKHKFPGHHHKDRKFYFGLNENVCKNVETFLIAGFRYYYLVMVKPFYKKEIPSMYLLGDLEARDKTFFAGCEINLSRIREIMAAKPVEAGKHTSHGGKSKMKVFPVFIDMFKYLCTLNEPLERIAEVVAKAVADDDSFPQLTKNDVYSRRVAPKFYENASPSAS